MGRRAPAGLGKDLVEAFDQGGEALIDHLPGEVLEGLRVPFLRLPLMASMSSVGRCRTRKTIASALGSRRFMVELLGGKIFRLTQGGFSGGEWF